MEGGGGEKSQLSRRKQIKSEVNTIKLVPTRKTQLTPQLIG